MEYKRDIFPNSSKGWKESRTIIHTSLKPSLLMKLFEDGLKEIYWIENALLKSLPRMIRKANSAEFIEVLTLHLESTRIQISRLEKVFGLIDAKAKGCKNVVMDGLMKEVYEIMETYEEGSIRDAGIISTVQKVEQYEFASYEKLRQFAESLEFYEIEQLLNITLQEDKEASQGNCLN